MKGKISFGDEEEDEGYNLVVPKKTIVMEGIKFEKPVGKGVRGLKLSSAAASGNSPIQRPLLDLKSIEDKVVEEEQQAIATTELSKGIESDEAHDFRLAERVRRAKEERRRQASEGLLDHFIALAETTNMELDFNERDEVSYLAFQETSVRQNSRKTWEDPDDAGETVNKRKNMLEVYDSDPEDEPTVVTTDAIAEEFRDIDTYTPSDTSRIEMKKVLKSSRHEEFLKEVAGMDLSEAEDEGSIYWELQQIKKGTGSNVNGLGETRTTTKILESKGATAAFKTDDRVPIRIVPLEKLALEISNKFATVAPKLEEKQTILTKINLHQEELENKMRLSNGKIEASRKKISFHTEIQGYIASFASMVKDLMPELEIIERQRLDQLAESKILYEAFILTNMTLDKNLENLFRDFTADLKVSEIAENLFQDADSDFSTASSVIHKLDEWQRGDPKSFENCYVGLCIPDLLEIFNRSEVLRFDPIALDANGILKAFEMIPDYARVKCASMMATNLIPLISAGFSPLVPPKRVGAFLDKILESGASSVALQGIKEAINRSFMNFKADGFPMIANLLLSAKHLAPQIDLSYTIFKGNILDSFRPSELELQELYSLYAYEEIATDIANYYSTNKI